VFSTDFPSTCRRFTPPLAALGAAVVLLAAAALPGGLVAHPVGGAVLLGAALLCWAAGAGFAPLANARVLLGLLLCLRLVGLLASPTLSDDIFRYVHEGRASRLGLAVPFATPPAALVPPPDDGTTARVNHPEVPAVYPPLSQLVLLGTVAAGDALGAPTLPLRLVLALADALLVLLLFARRRERPRAFVLYGLHPLPLLEAVVGSHLDALGAALVGAALLLAMRPFARGVLLGLACGVKPIAALALVGLPRGRQGLALAVAGLCAGVLVPTLPYLVERAPLTRGLLEYVTRWEAQPTLHAGLQALVAPPFERRHAAGRFTHLHVSWGPLGLLVEEAGEPRLSAFAARPAERPLLLDHRLLARGLAGALLLFGLALGLRLVREGSARVTLASSLLWLLAPTLHPWYLLWPLPFAALSRSTGVLLWAGLAPLAYEASMGAQAGGEWREALWPRALMLAALLLGTAFDAWRARREARSPS
jgi:hypothetical protein